MQIAFLARVYQDFRCQLDLDNCIRTYPGLYPPLLATALTTHSSPPWCNLYVLLFTDAEGVTGPNFATPNYSSGFFLQQTYSSINAEPVPVEKRFL